MLLRLVHDFRPWFSSLFSIGFPRLAQVCSLLSSKRSQTCKSAHGCMGIHFLALLSFAASRCMTTSALTQNILLYVSHGFFCCVFVNLTTITSGSTQGEIFGVRSVQVCFSLINFGRSTWMDTFMQSDIANEMESIECNVCVRINLMLSSRHIWTHPLICLQTPPLLFPSPISAVICRQLLDDALE